MLKRLLLVSTALFFHAHANAGTIVCSGTVEDISYHANDKLMIRLSSMNVPIFICNPSAEWVVAGTSYRTSAETCKTLFSTFLAARISGQEIRSLYLDGADVPASCGAWEPWKSANIRHFKL